MPKSKTPEKKIEKKTTRPVEELDKIIEIDEEAKMTDDLELIPGESEEDDPEDDAGLDEEEVDPFKDKWEE